MKLDIVGGCGLVRGTSKLVGAQQDADDFSRRGHRCMVWVVVSLF